MTSMREKAARAMCEADGQSWDYSVDEPDKNSPLHNDSLRDMYLSHAQAVLDALQDPTGAMIEAGLDWMPDDDAFKGPRNTRVPARCHVQSIFKAMIKAAGEEGT